MTDKRLKNASFITQGLYSLVCDALRGIFHCRCRDARIFHRRCVTDIY